MQQVGLHEMRTGPSGLPVMSACDVALGFPFGMGSAPLLDRPPEPDPVLALRAALRPALLRAPCVLAFSGGRDSSLLLAVAADLAAREGLDSPVAVTFRYPGDDRAQESSWQQLVVDHLRSQGRRFEWECVDIGAEFDVLGPLVTPLLRAHGGPLWPPALGSTVLLADLARGGSLVTGDYGDEVLGGHRANVLRTVVHRRGRGVSQDAWADVVLAAAPGPVRRRMLGRRIEAGEWLRPALRRQRIEISIRQAAAQPLRWDTSVRSTLQQRAATVGRQTLQAVTSRYDCGLVEPFGCPAFVVSLAAFGGRWGIGGRSAALRLLADGLLPEAIIERRDKAYFNSSRFGPATAEFVRRWDGTGLDNDLVDATKLRDAWSAEFVPAPTAMLLQQAWVSTVGERPPAAPNIARSLTTSWQEPGDGSN